MYRRVLQIQRKLTERHIEGAGLFIQFSVKPTSRAWQMTTQTTKAQEACVHDSEELNHRQLSGLPRMEVISGENTISI